VGPFVLFLENLFLFAQDADGHGSPMIICFVFRKSLSFCSRYVRAVID
jgi:hypothetical protein